MEIEGIKSALTEYFIKQKRFSGNILVSKNNNIIFNESYGYSDKENRIKNTPLTKFLIGSMTKTITALCIMQLCERGLLSVHKKIEDYIPDFYTGRGITIHHLLTHTSGIPNFVMLKKQIKREQLHTPQEILNIVKKHDLKFNPGKKCVYSNTNYLILGMIIEKVTGVDYHQYVKDNIFIRANMKDSGFIGEQLEDLACNYINGKKGFYMHPSMFFACGDIVSTIGDIYLLDQAIHNGKLLKKQTAIEMQRPQHDGKYIKSGYGLFIKNYFNRKSIYHSG